MKNNKIQVVGMLALLAVVFAVHAQTDFQFTAVAQTDEQAIRLAWASVSNEVYEIDEADALAGNPDGSTTWNKLYDDYPSQGTNTFWLDTGNYNFSPQILHPKNMPMRFYRVVDLGTDTTSDEPTVSISSPTNNATVSGELTITVIASTDQPVLSGTKLYVDGQEMQMADTTTNFTDSSGVTNYEVDTYSLNTCEWGNGTHILFATARCLSSLEGPDDIGAISTGHGVSSFVPVTFGNLVTRIAFSQPSFDPSSGQTQQVSAVFGANCNWTLSIRDINGNAVRTVTGSGVSMSYNWNGTDDGNTNIPTGIYFYYITAQINGVAFSPMSSTAGSRMSSAMSLSSVSEDEPSQLWAVAPDSSAPVPLAILPPGINTNGFTTFEASQSEMRALTAAASSSVDNRASVSRAAAFAAYESDGGGSSAGFTPADIPITPLPNPQPAPPAPQRPPNNPIKGLAGTFGIAYQTYLANGTNGYSSIPKPLTYPGGQPPSRISLQNYGSANSRPQFGPLKESYYEGNNFIAAMSKYGWGEGFCKIDDQLNINDLRGSGTPFNSVNLGLLMLHGTYGTTADYTVSGCKQMYFPIASGTSAQYLRMSEMNFGGAGTNGLKWMAIMGCFSLYHVNWTSMQGQNIKPYNSNLHLLLGADTLIYTDNHLAALWAQYLTKGKGTNTTPMTIRQAWYQAATDAYHQSGQNYGITMKFAAAGDSACLDDSLQTNNTPSGSWTYPPPVQVYP